jgi:hypothetical protein
VITPGRTFAQRCTQFAASLFDSVLDNAAREESYGVETTMIDASVSAAARASVV